MNVLHVPYAYWPDPVGGPEVYVRSLVRELRLRGVPSVIAAPGETDVQERIDDVWVFRYVIGESDDLRHVYGMPDPQVGTSFARVLAELEPDIVHFHAWSRGVSQACADAARASGAKVVWTYHTPTLTCPRGTLLKDGESPCEGKFDAHECARCVMTGHVSFGSIARAAAAIPPWVGERALERLAPSKARTALVMHHLLALREQAWRASVGSADRVVAVCDWGERVLRLNGIAADRLRVCRLGTDYHADPVEPGVARRNRTGPLRAVYFGRASHEKGLDVLLEAMERAPKANVNLDLYLSIQSDSGRAMVEAAKGATADDRRFHWFDAVPSHRVHPILGAADITIVPSQVFETGPLVVLESFAAGTPVLGSRLGGIAELVKDGVTGLLFRHDDPDEWARALERLAARRDLVASLAINIRPPRTTADVAAEHEAIYRELVPE